MAAATVRRACAWCRRVADQNGEYRGEPEPALHPADTHGICPACCAEMVAEVEQAHARRAARCA